MNENTKNGAFRKKKVYFSQVSNVALRDNNLSLKAKGLYALIQSYITIEDFVLYKTTLKKQCIEGEKAFESTWKELKDAGYLIQYRLQDKTPNEEGKVLNTFYYEYELLDAPDVELAAKAHGSQNRKTKEEKTHTPKKVGMGKKEKKQPKTHTPKMDTMDNGYDGQGVVYINSDLNNTDLSNIDLTTTDAPKGEVATLIESNTSLKLSEPQQATVDEWDIERTRKAIASFNTRKGIYFTYLETIYKETKNNNVSPRTGNSRYTDILKHDYNYDELDLLEQQYIDRKLAGLQ